MKKRGQITLIIILAIIILVVVVFVLRPRSDNKSPITEIPTYTQQVSHVRDKILSCYQDLAFPGIQLMGIQGGKIIPENYYNASYVRIEYGYYEGQFTLPTLADMEQELEEYVAATVPACLNPEEFPNLEITEVAQPRAAVKIEQDKILISLNYPLSIKEQELTTDLKEPYSLTLPIRLGLIYSDARGIISKTMQEPDYYQISYLLDLTEQGMDIDILTFENQTTVYMITDYNSTVQNTPFTFMFANKFTE